ncbi:hypothetical protein F8158_22765 [Bacillus cereus]|uniref:Transposase n=1 Tax=Bacillus cereus TaxID=1396 RepID=A0AB34D4L9_BACCE|nr:hypothetical protein [Bacillus cereus]KAB2493191.1 hypothetical protein F8158_22765 [Bacillus cereus]
MKEGLYYEDIRDGEILKCRTFTRSCYLFQRSNGELIEREKTTHYKRVKSKKKIAVFEGNNVSNSKKPSNRKERVDFLIRKIGFDVISKSLASMTDREVKVLFEGAYLTYRDREDYRAPKYQTPECLICGSETVTHWDCACGHAIIDADDPGLQELKDNGEFKRIQESLTR